MNEATLLDVLCNYFNSVEGLMDAIILQEQL